MGKMTKDYAAELVTMKKRDNGLTCMKRGCQGERKDGRSRWCAKCGPVIRKEISKASVKAKREAMKKAERMADRLLGKTKRKAA